MSNKVLVLFSLCLVFFSENQGFGQSCADLGHVYKLGATMVIVKQESCDSWVRQRYDPDGIPEGEPSTITFSEKWIESEIDDDYEQGSYRHRWFWSNDRKSIIHDFIFDKINKKSGVKSFGSLSEAFKIEKDKIRRIGVKILREEDSTGQVKISSEPSDMFLEKPAHSSK